MTVCVGDTGFGWVDIIKPLIEEAKEKGIKVKQIKEKFGSLRFYVDREGMYDSIRKAENKSEITCENCGKEGSLKRKGWIKCLCKECETVDNYVEWYV